MSIPFMLNPLSNIYHHLPPPSAPPLPLYDLLLPLGLFRAIRYIGGPRNETISPPPPSPLLPPHVMQQLFLPHPSSISQPLFFFPQFHQPSPPPPPPPSPTNFISIRKSPLRGAIVYYTTPKTAESLHEIVDACGATKALDWKHYKPEMDPPQYPGDRCRKRSTKTVVLVDVEDVETLLEIVEKTFLNGPVEFYDVKILGVMRIAASTGISVEWERYYCGGVLSDTW